MILRQATSFDISTVSGIAQSVTLHFFDDNGADKDISGCTFLCAIRGPGAASIKCDAVDASTARLAWSPLKSGTHVYDLFLIDLDGMERPLIKGEIQADPRVTPPLKDDVVMIGEIEITVPDAVDGEVRVIDAASGAADRAETAARKAQTAKEASEQIANDLSTAAANAGESARTANEAATAAQQALAAIPQVDADGNMTLAGSLTAPTATINGVFHVRNTGTSAQYINWIEGPTWFTGQVELRQGAVVRDDVWVETGVIRIGYRAALAATGPVNVQTLTASQCINANGGINIPLPPVRSGDAVNLGNLPMMAFAPTQQIHVTKSAWEIRGTCNDTAQGLAFNFLNPGEFVGACARVMQWSDSQSYSTIMTTVILTDWFGGNVLVDLAYSNNNISITPISSSDTPFLEQAIQLSIFESQDGDNITGRIINSDGEATSFSAPYKFSHSCVIRIFLLETGSTLRVYLGRFTSGMVDGEETALTLPLLLGEVPIKTGIKRACWLGIGGIRSAEPSDITGRLPVINSVNRYYGKWLNNLFQ